MNSTLQLPCLCATHIFHCLGRYFVQPLMWSWKPTKEKTLLTLIKIKEKICPFCFVSSHQTLFMYSCLLMCYPKTQYSREKRSVKKAYLALSLQPPERTFQLPQNKLRKNVSHVLVSGKVVARTDEALGFWYACLSHAVLPNVFGILLTSCEKNERDFLFWSISRTVSEVLALSGAACDNGDKCSWLKPPAARRLYLPTRV